MSPSPSPSSPRPSPRSVPAPRPGLARLEWLLPLALCAGFVLSGVRATPFAHSPLALGGITVLYAELALLQTDEDLRPVRDRPEVQALLLKN